MSRPGEQCPDGLELITTPRRACSQTSNCISVYTLVIILSTRLYVHGIAIGHDFGLTDAFQ